MGGWNRVLGWSVFVQIYILGVGHTRRLPSGRPRVAASRAVAELY
jgi:hypothetical protein